MTAPSPLSDPCQWNRCVEFSLRSIWIYAHSWIISHTQISKRRLTDWYIETDISENIDSKCKHTYLIIDLKSLVRTSVSLLTSVFDTEGIQVCRVLRRVLCSHIHCFQCTAHNITHRGSTNQTHRDTQAANKNICDHHLKPNHAGEL